MDIFKIERFNDDSGEIPFPWYRSLYEEDILCIKEKVAMKLGLSEIINTNDLNQILEESIERIPDFDAEDNSFILSAIFETLGINPCSYLYLDWISSAKEKWNGFLEIDYMKTTDVVSYFHDLWYPIVDDLRIYDPSLSWFLRVWHDGWIFFGSFNTMKGK